MDSMSDSEADNIVVAMAKPSGPFGDAFEVENAARPKKSARGRKPTTYASKQRKRSHLQFDPEESHPRALVTPSPSSSKSPSVATERSKGKRTADSPATHSSASKNNSSARKSIPTSACTQSHSPSSPSHPIKIPDSLDSPPRARTATKANNEKTSTSNGIKDAAVFSKLSFTYNERNKNRLCELWGIDTCTLDDAFGNVSDEASGRFSTLSAPKTFIIKLLNLAQMTGLRFCGAKSELERAKAERVRGSDDGANHADDVAWVVEDIERVMEIFTTEKRKPGPGSRKRTASQAGVEQDQNGRPSPAETSSQKRPHAQSDLTPTVARQNAAPRPMVVVNTRTEQTTPMDIDEETDEDELSERASVPRASSSEAMLEAPRNKSQAVQPKPQPEPASSSVQASKTQAQTSPPRTQTSQAKSQPQVHFQRGTADNPVRTQQTPSRPQTAVPPQSQSYSSVPAQSGPRPNVVAPPRPNSTPSHPRPPPSPVTAHTRGGQSQTRPSTATARLGPETPSQSTPPLKGPRAGHFAPRLPQTSPPQTGPLQTIPQATQSQATPQSQRQGKSRTGMDLSTIINSHTSSVRSLLNEAMPTSLHDMPNGDVRHVGVATVNAEGRSSLPHTVIPNVAGPPKGPVAECNKTGPSCNRTPAPVTNGPKALVPISAILSSANTPVSSPEPVSVLPVPSPPIPNTRVSPQIQQAAMSNPPVSHIPGSNAPVSVSSRTQSSGAAPNQTAQRKDRGSSQDETAEAGTNKEHNEALRRLENNQPLSPSIFTYIIQTFCYISASHVAVDTITSSTSSTTKVPSFFLHNYNTIIIPFYLDSWWSLATLDPEGRAITVYGLSKGHENIGKAATSLATTWLDKADAPAWSKTYIPMRQATNDWDESIVCLVAAMHMFAGVAPPHETPDPGLWRSIIAALLRAFAASSSSSSSFPSPSSSSTSSPILSAAYTDADADANSSDQRDEDVSPSALLIPLPRRLSSSTTTDAITLHSCFAHIASVVNAFRAKHQDRLAQARSRRDNVAHAHALLGRKLLAPPWLDAQRHAYAARAAEMRALAESTEHTIASLTRVRSGLISQAALDELRAARVGAEMVVKADAARVEGLERLVRREGQGQGGGGGTVAVGRYVGRLAEKTEGRVRKLVKDWETVERELGSECGALAGMFGRKVPGGQGGGGVVRGTGVGAAADGPSAVSAGNGQGAGGAVPGRS